MDYLRMFFFVFLLVCIIVHDSFAIEYSVEALMKDNFTENAQANWDYVAENYFKRTSLVGINFNKEGSDRLPIMESKVWKSTNGEQYAKYLRTFNKNSKEYYTRMKGAKAWVKMMKNKPLEMSEKEYDKQQAELENKLIDIQDKPSSSEHSVSEIHPKFNPEAYSNRMKSVEAWINVENNRTSSMSEADFDIFSEEERQKHEYIAQELNENRFTDVQDIQDKPSPSIEHSSGCFECSVL